jgi:5-methylthioadenosine/S-adenosylhomocysteine deaminase
VELKRRYPEEPVRDFGMAAVMPGFVDCHSHLEHAIMRGVLNDTPYAAWKAFIREKEELFTEQDWRDSAMLGAFEAVSAGITTVADVTATGASYEAAEHLGLRGVVYREVAATSREEAPAAMEQAVAQIEAWQAGAASDRFTFGIAPDSVYTCHPQVLQEAARYACEAKVPLAIHLAGCEEECDFVRYGSSPFAESLKLLPAGCSPVQYALNWGVFEAPQVLAVHCVKVDDHDIDVLREYGVNVAACPRANAKLGMGLAPIVKMRRAGVSVGLGTDSPAAADSIDPIEEMRFTMLALRATNGKAGFIEGPDMIRLATLDSAKALGLDHLVGSLDPGKQADIVAIDLSDSRQAPTHFPTSAVVHTANRDNVLMTMVGGRVIFDANDRFGHVLTADMGELRRIMVDVERLRKRLRS